MLFDRANPVVVVLSVLLAASAWLSGCVSQDQPSTRGSAAADRVPILGACEGCEGIFEGMPKTLTHVARIAREDEPGEPMHIEGIVRWPDGSVAPGTIIYAYHTNSDGIYPKDERWRGRAAYRHGTLRAWAAADEDGRYAFRTIRPRGYPDSREPVHVHLHVLEPGRCTYYIDSIEFTDDPRLPAELHDGRAHPRGGSGVTTPQRNDVDDDDDNDGVWHITRHITLGENIPSYPAR